MSAIHLLYIGKKRTDVSVREDPKHPHIWRIHQGDRVSDMVNLSRAKDAAISWAFPKGGMSSTAVVYWHKREAPAGTPYIRHFEEGVSQQQAAE